jgi:acetolactate synthase-1/2/3 large subunit
VSTKLRKRSGGQVLAEQLRIHGVERAFCVPGESYLALLDALYTRGPGATNASAGVHIAFQDSTPLLLLVGQVARRMTDREAFQEIDYRRMYGQMAKWVAQIEDPARIPEYISRAFYTATSGRPGPVVLALGRQRHAPTSSYSLRRITCP